MSVGGSARKIWDNPIGRLLTLLAGVGFVAGVLTIYPKFLPVIKWAMPMSLVLWGISRFFFFGVENPITVVAGSLLIFGGFAYASYHWLFASRRGTLLAVGIAPRFPR
ncbi:Uncharacterized protein HSRCO_2898 [Halanaeroarchaeum sp. HSR-CO]|uniref:hypothetical protein n=1 Tax=Halanaeroarchaeum sp. HSR-CO TaxID=2866382 RepID=UPI00217D6B1F|nr:hypothetical protein [Halanaeroarchaeum sp. HSR-CO]UWG47843.1 Uncharacterized protein HSRCO_2898 [Halanaeroarchaeum sp. HSR-CO]